MVCDCTRGRFYSSERKIKKERTRERERKTRKKERKTEKGKERKKAHSTYLFNAVPLFNLHECQ